MSVKPEEVEKWLLLPWLHELGRARHRRRHEGAFER